MTEKMTLNMEDLAMVNGGFTTKTEEFITFLKDNHHLKSAAILEMQEIERDLGAEEFKDFFGDDLDEVMRAIDFIYG